MTALSGTPVSNLDKRTYKVLLVLDDSSGLIQMKPAS